MVRIDSVWKVALLQPGIVSFVHEEASHDLEDPTQRRTRCLFILGPMKRALSISQLAFYCTLVISQMFIALRGLP